MTDDILLLLAHLLQYPDAAFSDMVKRLSPEDIAAFPQGLRNRLFDFQEYIHNSDLLDIQTLYTETFDLDPQSSLNLTWHSHGHDADRGRVLAELAGLYRRAGVEPVAGELPDYLPLMLEFTAVMDEKQSAALLPHFSSIRSITDSLRQKTNPYSGLFEVLEELLPIESGREGMA